MKTAIVTGASRGIGKGIAIALSKDGWEVIAVARNIVLLEELAKANANITPYQLDVTDSEGISKFKNYIEGKQIDLLVNNAGSNFEQAKITEANPKMWMESYKLNVIAPMEFSKAIVPSMIRFEKGHIVFITSVVGHTDMYPGGGNYTAAKHAEVTLAEQLRLELRETPIRVTELAPGMVNSNENSKHPKAVEVEDIASAVLWANSLPTTANVDRLLINPN
jgi:NADP-dependent 3-hydroxy acid dehydrogenase YdfG